jgi:hypothetical protein
MVVGALAIGMLLSYGIFAYASVLSPPKGHSDGINLGDEVTIEVFNPDGTLARVWHGYNSLLPQGINAIAGCISGATTTPYGWGSCSSGIGGITIQWDVDLSNSPVTNTPFANSAGNPCDPSTGAPDCTGWVSTATFPSTTFTTSNCGSSCTIFRAAASASGGSVYFDSISTSLEVVPGDSVVVTITFNVS